MFGGGEFVAGARLGNDPYFRVSVLTPTAGMDVRTDEEGGPSRAVLPSQVPAREARRGASCWASWGSRMPAAPVADNAQLSNSA